MDGINKDIRWKQRFQNFRRAFGLLREAMTGRDIGAYSALELEGVVQRFEYSFELAWKTLKDYLEYNGVVLAEATPRKVIKECAALGVFAEAGINGETYLEMMLARNALSHMHDFKLFEEMTEKIKSKFLRELEMEFLFLSKKEMDDDA